MDYISREDAPRIVNVTDIDTIRLEDVKRITNKCAKGIKALPAADVVERNVGKWLPIIDADEYGEPYQSGVYCSECGEMLCYVPHFCPNCGAKMEDNE